MLSNLLLLLIILLFPALALFLERRSRFVEWISPVALCYLAGIIMGNLPLYTPNAQLLEYITNGSVGIAIPIMLFNSKLSEWIRYSGKMLFSYLLCCVGAIISAVIFFVLFKANLPKAAETAGMLVGVYVGGTVNMSAIGIAMDVDNEIFILLNSSDTIIGAVYFAFLITIGKKILGFFLPDFVPDKVSETGAVREMASQKISLKLLYNAIILIIIALGLLGLAISITTVITGKMEFPWILLILTSCGIGVSFIKGIREIKGSYDIANYFLLIFAIAIGAQANVHQLIVKSPVIFFYVNFVMWLAILIHFILAAIFRIDRDTVIITSTAGIFSVPFIGVVAKAIKNDHVIAPGIAMGLLGYAIGNYMGIGLAMLLR
ncbi:MAG TPA: DUF819 family protein [Cyclobacteriaceae bacterium]|nr:DUF819 family protein [Cyclobacteriaceae bacterium]